MKCGRFYALLCAMNHIKHFQSPQKHFFVKFQATLGPARRVNNNRANWLALPTTDDKQEKVLLILMATPGGLSLSESFRFFISYMSHSHPHRARRLRPKSRLLAVVDASNNRQPFFDFFVRLNSRQFSISGAGEMFCDGEKPETCKIFQASHETFLVS